MAHSEKFCIPNLIRRFGNLTATSVSEVTVAARAYVEQSSQAQRSVKSSSAVDSNTLGTGARTVRITYLDSNYVLKTEDVNLNGITGVNTTATDIRFIESFEVIKGTEAVGAISLMTTTGGGGTEFCGIPAATTQAFLCHHYVPAGKQAWVITWGAVVDDEVSLKLIGQDRPNTIDLVNRIHDLEKVFAGNPTPPQHLGFERELGAVLAPEKSYVRITVVPNQATSTVIRTYFYCFEEPTNPLA